MSAVLHKLIFFIKAAFPIAQGYATWVFVILSAITLGLFGIGVINGKNDLRELFSLLIKIGFLLWLFRNIDNIAIAFVNSLLKIISSSFQDTMGVDSGQVFDLFYNPDKVLEFGWNSVVEPMEKLINETSGKFSIFKIDGQALGLYFTLLVAKLAITIVFLLIGLQIALAWVEFWICLFMGMILTPFAVFKPTEFIGQKVFPAIAGQAIKLAIICLVSSIACSIFASIVTVPSVEDFNLKWVLSLLGAALFLAVMAFQIPALASSLLSGVPNMGASGFLANTRSLMQIGATAFRGAGKFSPASLRSKATALKQNFSAVKQGAQKIGAGAKAIGQGAGNAFSRTKNAMQNIKSKLSGNSPSSPSSDTGTNTNNFRRPQ